MKFGYVAAYNRTDNQNHYNDTRVNYRFLNGVPNQLTMNLGEFLIRHPEHLEAFEVTASPEPRAADAAASG